MAKTVTKVEDTKTLKAVKDKAVWSIEERNDAGPVPWIPIWLHWPLFAFPYFANDWSARFVGMQVCITSLILAVIKLAQAGSALTIAWLSAVLFAGFLIRFIWGGSYSLLGAIGNIFARRLEVDLISGPPKQFAAFCGIMFSFGAMIANFYGPFYAGPIIHLALAGAAGLEGFAGFCVGCWFFTNLLIPLGIADQTYVSRSVKVVLDQKQAAEEKFAYHKNNQGPSRSFQGYIAPTTSEGRPLMFKYSDKTIEQREDDVNFIKHCQLTYCLPGLAWAALGANFKALFLSGFLSEQYPWVICTIVGIVLFGGWAVLYVCKLVFNFNRVLKEVDNLHTRYYLAGIPIAFLLFGYLAQREEDDVARALFWLGSMSNLTLTLWLFTRLLIHPVSSGSVTPGMTIPLLGNMLAALTLEQWLDWPGMSDLAYFLWAPSFLLWILLAPGLLLRLIDAPALQSMLRVTVMTYFAVPALSAQTWLILTGFDAVFLGLFFFAVTMQLYTAMLFVFNYFRAKFNTSYWFSVFCMAAITFPLISFHQSRQTDFTYAWLMAQFAVTTGLTLIFTAHTLGNVANGKWFRVAPKPAGVGPFAGLSKLTHDAFRTAGRKINYLIEEVKDKDTSAERKAEKKEELLSLVEGYMVTLEIHSYFEDNIMFPAVDAYLPGREKRAEEEHKELVKMEERAKELFIAIQKGKTILSGAGAHGFKPRRESVAVSQNIEPDAKKGLLVANENTAKRASLSIGGRETAERKVEENKDVTNIELKEVKNDEGVGTTDSGDALDELMTLFPKLIEGNNEHMRGEEDHISPILRKILPSKEMKSLARKSLRTSTPGKWRIMLPFVIKNQDYHMRRVRFLTSLRIAYPERMQMYGGYLYTGIDEVLFNRLRVDFPEIAPRHTEGHWRLW